MEPQEIEEAPMEMIENEDGSVDVMDMDDPTEQGEFVFLENLALKIPPEGLHEMGSRYAELITKDKESRAARDKQYEEGLRRSGLGDDAPGGAEFEGASKAVHPVIAEACIDFSSRAIKELFPPQGPVKTQIAGKITGALLEKATRKARFMNWQLTSQMQEYFPELEQLLTQLPMGGSQYLKFWYDTDQQRPVCEFVPVDDIMLPYAATSFYTSPRVTHRQLITKDEFNSRVASGLYRDVFAPDATTVPESTLAGVASDKIEGREDDGYNEDGLRAVLEIYAWDEIGIDTVTESKRAPYIISVDEDTEEVLGVYRNWLEADQKRGKLDWIVEWRFIPWRGAYGIGLPHLIGGLSAALTGALRALLDSAHINNAPTMLKLGSGRVIGQSKSVDITQICDIEGPAGIDDIRKLAMPMPFNPPSPVLLSLIDKLYGLSKGVVNTASEAMQDSSNRTPVGTTMAVVEEGSITYSAIHMRLHNSQKKSLEVLHRINSMFMVQPPDDAVNIALEQGDFQGPMDVVPVSDPNIFSEAQRFAQIQALVQMSADQTVPWNKLNIYRRVLKQMRIDEVDEILPGQPQPVTADPLAEDSAIFVKRGFAKAGEDQDHMAHIMAHLSYISSPLIMHNTQVPLEPVQHAVSHINEHIMMFYAQVVGALAQNVMMMAQFQQQQITPDKAIAQAVPQANQMLAPQLGPIVQQLEQVIQIVKGRTPPPELPPELQLQKDLGMAEIKRKTQADQISANLKNAEAQFKQMVEAADQQREQAMLEFNQKLEQQRVMLTAALGQLTQQTEINKNSADNQQKQMTEIMKNHEDNQTNLLMAQMREMGQKQTAAAQLEYKAQQDKIQRVVDLALETQRLVMESRKQQDDTGVAKLQAIVEAAQKADGDNALKTMVQGLQKTIESMNKPKRVVRNAKGDIEGVE